MRVGALFVYPVKSVAGVRVSSLTFDPRGPLGDRRWLLVDAKSGVALTQRDLPAMSQIEVSLSGDGKNQSLRAVMRATPTRGEISVRLVEHQLRKQVQVWSTNIDALDAGDAAAQWFSDCLGRSCRLVYQDDAAIRAIRRYPQHQVSFADGYPLLILSQAAVDHLQGRFGAAVSPLRFRPNILIEGCDAHAEDNWKKISIGDMSFDVVGHCERCTVPSLDPNSGEVTAGFNRALAEYRRFREVIVFGQNAIHRGLGTIAVGDEVRVLEAAN